MKSGVTAESVLSVMPMKPAEGPPKDPVLYEATIRSFVEKVPAKPKESAATPASEEEEVPDEEDEEDDDDDSDEEEEEFPTVLLKLMD
eukprot:SAG22_NODE_10815_length_514_cov_1.645783_1_plen_87_part_10